MENSNKISTTVLGRYGEMAAADYLVKNGFKILKMNFRYSHLELDIIAENERFVHFIEVKSRTNNPVNFQKYGLPKRAVNRKKQRFIIAAANHYIRTHHLKDRLYSLDVIEVYFKPSNNGKLPEIDKINHIKGAYYA